MSLEMRQQQKAKTTMTKISSIPPMPPIIARTAEVDNCPPGKHGVIIFCHTMNYIYIYCLQGSGYVFSRHMIYIARTFLIICMIKDMI